METKAYRELDFSDDFMFCKILSNNPELCKELLELILDQKIKNIIYVTKQEEIKVTADGRGVRLDVYLEGEEAVYDIEMQSVVRKNLPKRSRYYQGMIDLNLIEAGADFKELRKSFVIFICKQDPFGYEESVYTFENCCLQNPRIKLGDEAVKIFLNAEGKTKKISRELKAFLDYIAGKKPNSILTEKLEEQVKAAKKAEKWKVEYMTLDQLKKEMYEDGLEEGKRLGLEQGLEQGLTQGFQQIVSNMLQKKKTIEEIENLTGICGEDIKKIIDTISEENS